MVDEPKTPRKIAKRGPCLEGRLTLDHYDMFGIPLIMSSL